MSSYYAEPWEAYVRALEQEIELAPTHPTGALRTVLGAAKEGLEEAQRMDNRVSDDEYADYMGQDM